MRNVIIAAIGGASGMFSGCRSGPEPAAGADAAIETARPAHRLSGAGPAAHDSGARGAFPCRAIVVEGRGRSADTREPLALDGEIPDAWLLLEPGARLVAKDPRTTRETIFSGPARARACAGYREESWIAAGAFDSQTGAGEAPGAEEWVVTPHAVVRYASAQITIRVSATGTHASVGKGIAYLWAAGDARVEAHAEAGASGSARRGRDTEWLRLENGAIGLLFAGSAQPAARASVDQCESVAADSQELTRALLAPLSEPRVKDSPVETQVNTRRAARAACTLAALRVGDLSPSDARDVLLRRLDAANAAWTALPVAARPR